MDVPEYDVDPTETGPFRSWLECRFAWKLVEWKLLWIYEPRAYQIDSTVWYTPDFEVWIPNRKLPALIEVKPTLGMALQDKRLKKLAKMVDNPCAYAWSTWPKWHFIAPPKADQRDSEFSNNGEVLASFLDRNDDPTRWEDRDR